MSWFNLGTKSPIDLRAEQANAAALIAEQNLRIRLDAIQTTQPIVEFGLDGRIVDANPVFCTMAGVSSDEVRTQPLSRFMVQKDGEGSSDRAFWDRLARGEAQTGQLRLTAGGGKEIWLQMGYAPIPDAGGKGIRIVGTGVDVTAFVQKMARNSAERRAQRGLLEAISASFAEIEFDTSGHVLNANPNFLMLMGYQLEDIVGKPHRTFVDPSYAASSAYAQFWPDLAAGKTISDVFKRITRSGGEVWIQASYTPVKDEAGRVTKVVKIATDVTVEGLKAAIWKWRPAGLNNPQP